jgi:DNA polymerase-1
LGLAYYDQSNNFFVPFNNLKEFLPLIKGKIKYTYDLKKLYVALKWQGLEIDNVIFDTMIAGYLLDYNIKDDVAVLANNFNYDIPFYDMVFGKTKFTLPDMAIIASNAMLKAEFIYETYNQFKDKLISEELMDLFNTMEMPLTYVLGDMEYAGINVDRNTLIEMGKEINIKIELVSQTIYNHAGEVFNISSPKQLGEILFEKLGLKHGKKNANGYSTSVDVLEKLKNTHPIIEAIMEYRMLTKLYTTYIEGLLNSTMDDNKIHTIYNQTLTRTGRLSSIEPNLQNIPVRYEYGKLIRKAFIPSSKSVILSGDYSQIELRILAHMANVPALIEAFKQNKDIHTKTASDIFHVPEVNVTKEMRRMAKAVNFGIIYGISGYGLSENLGIAPNEASKFIKDYLSIYPGIKAYMDNVIKDAHANGYVRTLFNRKRNIPELNNKNYMIRAGGERMALNTPIQGTQADIIKLAMIRIHDELKKRNLKTKMILQVHDELIFDCLESEKDEIIKLVADIMNHVCELSVPLRVDIEYGDNWYNAK